MWWYITLSYAVYALEVRDGVVTQAPPIARWMIGRDWPFCKTWIAGKGGHGTPL